MNWVLSYLCAVHSFILLSSVHWLSFLPHWNLQKWRCHPRNKDLVGIFHQYLRPSPNRVTSLCTTMFWQTALAILPYQTPFPMAFSVGNVHEKRIYLCFSSYNSLVVFKYWTGPLLGWQAFNADRYDESCLLLGMSGYKTTQKTQRKLENHSKSWQKCLYDGP